ncbi:hypothetical protein BO83DRAFT_111321 [Aspergillus eucalypticola CBS 122712]|uniref:Uncharacterized protein n=1 Tax=Aspergillus eucalypticola (strain CBS 122712 / IBT 29274) TaxID=1448314 RepID=A0A317V085_ASPEC|nr:uncharacterized protein BO83DRAFT_111321 [Aspergillus eucalypticola CBS 122712]PWY66202.1 hypothetical protein BO83DRAFT_111321 [Aspergillus eucalypticola CBS 122712]
MLINALSSLVTPSASPWKVPVRDGDFFFLLFFTIYTHSHGEARTTADIADITVQSRCLNTRTLTRRSFGLVQSDNARSGNGCGSPHANIHLPEAFSFHRNTTIQHCLPSASGGSPP